MIEVQLQTVSEQLSLKDQRAEYGRLTREAIADEKRAAITAGCYLNLAFAGFTAEELKSGKWDEWATGATRKSIKTVEAYMAIGKAYTTSRKTEQKVISEWTMEALQAYAHTPEQDRPKVVAAVKAEDSNPSPEVVRAARDIIRDEQLSDDERNTRAAAKAKREAKTAADKTEAAREAVDMLIGRKTSLTPEQYLLIGVEVALAHGKYAEDGVKSYFVQRAEAKRKADEKAAKAKRLAEAEAKAEAAEKVAA